MPSFAYVNGRYILRQAASVSIDNRGFQYAESVYQTIAVINNKIIDWEDHIKRLNDSTMQCFGQVLPVCAMGLRLIVTELIHRNRCYNGACYIQVSGGEAKRSLVITDSTQPKPNIVITLTPMDFQFFPHDLKSINVITKPDPRHDLRHHKSTNLLSTIIAKKQVLQQNADDVWFYNDNGSNSQSNHQKLLNEGASNNIWIVNKLGQIITPPANKNIINGVTRSRLLQLMSAKCIDFVEKSFSLDDLYQAKEAFASASVSLIRPVTQVDGHKISDGKIGSVTKELAQLYCQYIAQND